MLTARVPRRRFSVRCTGEDDPIYPESLPPVRRTRVCAVIWQDTGADTRASHPPQNFGADGSRWWVRRTLNNVRTVCCAEPHS